MADLITREATPEEARPALRFCELVKGKRDLVSRALSAARAAANAQNWVVNNSIGYTGPLFNDEDAKKIQLLAERANKLEAYAAGLESQKLFFRPNATNSDLNIYRAQESSSSPDAWAGVALGIVPLIIVVAGVVLVAAAISVAIGFYMSAEEEETLYKKRVIELDKWAAGQDDATRAAWEAFKKENGKQDPGFWNGLTGALGSIVPLIAIGLGIWAFSKFSSSSSRSSAAEGGA